jgi:hypothetical protein
VEVESRKGTLREKNFVGALLGIQSLVHARQALYL